MTDDLVKRLREDVEEFDGTCGKLATLAANRIEELEKTLREATEYVGRFASVLAKKHYPEAANFELLPDLLGRIDQIDHMTYVMIRIGTQSNEIFGGNK